MKKVLSLTLALSMLLCFVACGGDGNDKDANPELVSYIESNKDEVYETFELDPEEATLKVSGNSFVFDITFEEFDDADEATIEMFKSYMTDELVTEQFGGAVEEYRETLPLDSVVFNMKNSKGKLILSVTAK